MLSARWFMVGQPLGAPGPNRAALMEVSEARLQSLLAHHRVVPPVGPSAWKEAGNVLLAKKEVAAAHACYTRGLEAAPADAALRCVLLSNRAQCALALNEPAMALLDASNAVEADSTHLKSPFRRGRALEALERYEEAASAYTAARDEKSASASGDRLREHTQGEYAWATLVKNTAAAGGECEHAVANFVRDTVRVVEVAGKGRGWVTASPLPRGTLVAVERAVAVVFPTR